MNTHIVCQIEAFVVRHIFLFSHVLKYIALTIPVFFSFISFAFVFFFYILKQIDYSGRVMTRLLFSVSIAYE